MGRWGRTFLYHERVIELGSRNVTGSIRPLVAGAVPSKYIGVDWRDGPGVDEVCLAHELIDKYPQGWFGAVLSASMLEHDPHWRKSLEVMHWLLADLGILLLSWGAANNPEHEVDSAPDGKFHARPARRVVQALKKLGFHIQEFRYEKCMPFNRHIVEGRRVPGGKLKRRERGVDVAPGCVCLAAFKVEQLIEQPVLINAFEDGDGVA